MEHYYFFFILDITQTYKQTRFVIEEIEKYSANIFQATTLVYKNFRL